MYVHDGHSLKVHAFQRGWVPRQFDFRSLEMMNECDAAITEWLCSQLEFEVNVSVFAARQKPAQCQGCHRIPALPATKRFKAGFGARVKEPA